MDSGSDAPRTSVQLLVDRNFGVLFWGKLFSLIAAWALMAVVVILAYNATGSAAWAGAMAAAQSGPQLVLALVSGRLSDTYGPLSQIIVGTLMSGFAALGLLTWWLLATPAGAALPIALLIASLVFGSGIALSAPAMHSVVPRLVTDEELSSAVALNFFPTALARTLGPAGGALLAAVFGPVTCLAAIAAVFLASGAFFLLIRLSPLHLDAHGPASHTVTAALRYVRGDRVLVVLLCGVAAVGFGAEPAITLAPALAEQVGGSGDHGGLVTSCFGGGGLLGVLGHRLLRRWFTPGAEGCVAMWTLAAAMMIAAAVGSLPALCVSLGVAGTAMVVGITAFSVAVQQRSEPGMLGRVMALWVLAFAGIRPVAGPIQGYLADAWSARTAVLASAVLTLAASGAVFAVLRAGSGSSRQLVTKGLSGQH